MQYLPELSAKEIEENHERFSERVSVYRKKGLDYTETRRLMLEKVKPLSGTILEIGTGTGYTTIALAEAGYEVATIDKDKEILKIAASNLAYLDILSKVKFYIMDGKSLSFEDKSFNNIFTVNLFHHIDGVNKMLAEIDRVLSVNGKILLADFNKRGMRIIESVHRQEGRVHENKNVTQNYVHSYFHDLGYDLKNFDNRYHWIVIGKKPA